MLCLLLILKVIQKPFATPRTWHYVNEVLLSTPEDDLIMALISGAIGEELAASFFRF